MLPIHWATFNLATHPWAEPGEGTLAAGRATGTRVAVPVPGEPFEPTAETVPTDPWWRAVALAPTGGWPATDALTEAAIKTSADAATKAQSDGNDSTQNGPAEGTGEPERVSAG
jgi:hypothetical protein